MSTKTHYEEMEKVFYYYLKYILLKIIVRGISNTTKHLLYFKNHIFYGHIIFLHSLWQKCINYFSLNELDFRNITRNILNT